MTKRQWLIALAAAAGLGAFFPAMAQTRGDGGTSPDGGMNDMGMGNGAMSGRHMGQGMMAGGCAGMMQSMNGGGGRPNSQWQTHRHDNATPD
jgi:hypothetical protein